MRKVERAEQMPEEYRQVLLKLIGALASTEFASVEQHQPWINRGPTPADRYIQAQIAAAEAESGDVQRAIDKWYPRALDTFGKSDSRASQLAVAYGLRRWGNAELRRMYREDIDAQLTALGLTVPPEDRGRKIL